MFSRQNGNRLLDFLEQEVNITYRDDGHDDVDSSYTNRCYILWVALWDTCLLKDQVAVEEYL